MGRPVLLYPLLASLRSASLVLRTRCRKIIQRCGNWSLSTIIFTQKHPVQSSDPALFACLLKFKQRKHSGSYLPFDEKQCVNALALGEFWRPYKILATVTEQAAENAVHYKINLVYCLMFSCNLTDSDVTWHKEICHDLFY